MVLATRSTPRAKPHQLASATSPVIEVDEIAEVLGLSQRSVYERLGAGIIPCQRLGRRFVVNRAEFERWVHEGRSSSSEAPTSAEPALELLRLLRAGPVTFEITIKLKGR